ncbi:MAG: dihydrofolate reductase [Bacteroidetes bacterium]|nr:dihydrofolate reductase [Bacteroidota bacterium]
MTISIIVALSENNVVGINNQLPWKLSADLKRVKGLTMGHHIIMGRKTYESIGRPLPGRVNVVITRNSDFNAEGCILAGSLAEALKISKSDPEVFIFGGGEIFREALPLVSKIYMTKVHHSLEGDTYFPLLDPSHWKEIEKVEFKADEKNEYDYSFITLEKI